MKILTDVHTHSTFSFDAQSPLTEMLKSAQEKGAWFYGVSEHYDNDYRFVDANQAVSFTDSEAYFHTARHLQEDYAGVMNVLVGAELGFCKIPQVHEEYQALCEKYQPDFIVNSVHSLLGHDYCFGAPYYKDGKLLDKDEIFREYLHLVRDSLDVPYPYDIVGHIGYVTRYLPYEDKTICLQTHREILTDILQTIIQKDKILEINAARDNLLPQRDIVQLYYHLGGRKVSYASDAHDTQSVMQRRERVVEMLKEIGFTHITVPCRGERIQIPL